MDGIDDRAVGALARLPERWKLRSIFGPTIVPFTTVKFAVNLIPTKPCYCPRFGLGLSWAFLCGPSEPFTNL